MLVVEDWKLGERYAMNIIADANSGCRAAVRGEDFGCSGEGWIDWNLCLDEEGGPNHVCHLAC